MTKAPQQTPNGAATILVVSAAACRVLGFVRDMALVARFGQSYISDAYYAAFTIPDFCYLLLIGAATGPVLVPLLSGYLAQGRQRDCLTLAKALFCWVLAGMAVCLVLGSWLAPQLMAVLAPGFSPRGRQLTVSLTRVMLWQSLFLALAAVGMGLLHTYNRYGPPAWGSLLYNLATVVFGVALAASWGIYGFAAGVVLGAALYLLAETPSLYRLYHGRRVPLQPRHPGVSTAARRTLPVLLGLSVQQINLIVSQNLASFLQPGAISALRQAQRLMQLPIGVFAIPLSVSLFAAMSRAAAQSDRNAYLNLFHQGVERILFLTLPAAAGLALLSRPLVALLYQRGAFDAQDSQRTAALLCLYCLGLACYGLTQLLNRAFYAQEDTKTPLKAATLAVAANILLSLALFPLWREAGLALAYSLAGFCHLALLVWLLRRTQGSLGGKQLSRAAAKPLLLTFIMGLALLAFRRLIPWGNDTMGLLCQVALGTAFGAAIYLGGHWLLARRWRRGT